MPQHHWIDIPLINNDNQFKIIAGPAAIPMDAVRACPLTTIPVSADNEDSP